MRDIDPKATTRPKSASVRRVRWAFLAGFAPSEAERAEYRRRLAAETASADPLRQARSAFFAALAPKQSTRPDSQADVGGDLADIGGD